MAKKISEAQRKMLNEIATAPVGGWLGADTVPRRRTWDALVIRGLVYQNGGRGAALTDAGRLALFGPPVSYAPEVIADDSGVWCGNALRFATREEAKKNVRDLSWRWMAVRETRVVTSQDPVNYRWDDATGLGSVDAPAPAGEAK